MLRPTSARAALTALALATLPLQATKTISDISGEAMDMPAGTDATADAIQALDTDGSGKVEKAEVEAFARSQGLSADEVSAEFKTLDTNGDGELEANEIHRTLYDDQDPAPQQRALRPAPTQAAERAPAAATLPAAAVVPARSSGGAGAMLEAQSLEQEAQRHAGKALAEVFARTAAKALESRSQDAEKASKLEEAARSLRGQTAEIRRTATAQTVKAAKEAAAAVLREAAGQVKQLEDQAAQAERQAVQKRREAKEAMERALAAQATISASMQQLRQQELA